MTAYITNHSGHHRCHLEPVDKPVTAQQLAMANTAVLLVRGMGCPTCAMRVRNALLSVDGVLVVNMMLERGLAVVHYDPIHIAPESLPAAVTTANDGRHNYAASVLQSL